MDFLNTEMIELASFQQIESSNKNELINACKLLKVKGYSKLNKPDLVQFVWISSDIGRQARITKKTAKQITDNKKAIQKNIQRSEVIKGHHPIRIDEIEKLIIDKELPLSIAVDTLFRSCESTFAKTTVAKNCTKRLKLILSEMVETLGNERIVEIIELWRQKVYALNYSRRSEEIASIKGFSKEAEGSLDTEKILDWVNTHISSNNPYELALALALSSGRRLSEIYGHTQFSIEGEFIKCEGLSKTKKRDEDRFDTKQKTAGIARIIPLIDKDVWMEAISRLPRNEPENRIRNSIPRLVSRHFPATLKEVGCDVNDSSKSVLSKFKDCRDFYAALIYSTASDMKSIRNPALVTQKIMGHRTKESTDYYFKFDVVVMESLKPSLDFYNDTLN